MSLSDMASAGSLISGIAVLISLIYLALQVRQAAMNQRSETQSNATGRRMDILLHMASAGMAEVMLRASAADPTTPPEEAFQFILTMQATLTNSEDEFFQYRSGMLDERRFKLQLAVNRGIFALPGARAVWRLTRTNFHPDFVVLMDDIVDNTPVATKNVVDFWKVVAADERAVAGRMA